MMSQYLKKFANVLFSSITTLTRSYGGVRPRRIAHWLGNFAYGTKTPRHDEYKWYKDRHGLEFHLHPHYLIDRNIIAFGTYDPTLQYFIDREISRGMTCFDVGANIGAVTLHLADKVGPTGCVHCFEPVPHVADRLQTHVNRNGMSSHVHLHRVALSDSTGEIDMVIASSDHTNQGMGSIVEFDHGDLVHRVRVRAVTLDELVQNHPINRFDFVKIDIQGAEPLMLRGARKTIEHFKPIIVMEVAPASLTSAKYTSDQLLASLEVLGYTAWQLDSRGKAQTRLYSKSCAPDFSVDNIAFYP